MRNYKFLFIVILIYSKSIVSLTNEDGLYKYSTDKILPSSKNVLKSSQLSNGLGIKIGFGHSNDRGLNTGLLCLNEGNISYIDNPLGFIQVTRRHSLEELKKQLNLEGQIGGYHPFFSSSATSEFLKNAEDSDLSQNFIFRTSFQLKDSLFQVKEDIDILNSIGKSLQKKPSDFRYHCGDSYISQITWGAAFYFQIKFHFQSQKDKRAFKANIDGGYLDIFNLKTSFNQEMTRIRNNGKISIQALQIGGDPSKLGQIIHAKNKTTARILECSFNQANTCLDMINEIILYASSKDNDGFPSQFKSRQQENAGLVPINVKILPYETLGLKITSPSLLTEEIIDVREKLQENFKSQIQELEKLRIIAEKYEYTEKKWQREVQTLIRDIEYNHELTKATGSQCYTDVINCHSRYKQYQRKLKRINLSILDNKYIEIFYPECEHLQIFMNNDVVPENGKEVGRWRCSESSNLGLCTKKLILLPGPSKQNRCVVSYAFLQAKSGEKIGSKSTSPANFPLYLSVSDLGNTCNQARPQSYQAIGSLLGADLIKLGVKTRNIKNLGINKIRKDFTTKISIRNNNIWACPQVALSTLEASYIGRIKIDF